MNSKHLNLLTQALRRGAFAFLVLAPISTSWGQGTPAGSFIRCKGQDGSVIVVDRSRARDCGSAPMTEVSPGGLSRGTLPPLESPSEVSTREEKEHKDRIKREAEKAKQKQEQTLLTKYPDEASVLAARERELEPPRLARARAERRLAELAAERKLLDDEAQFYANSPMPQKLKDQFRDNDGLVAVERALIQHARDEEANADKRYRERIALLGPIWDQPLPPPAAPAYRRGKTSKSF